jgi:hypothetical protein
MLARLMQRGRLFSLNTRVTHIIVACIVVDQITSKGFLRTALSYLEFSLHMHSFRQIRFRRLQPSQKGSRDGMVCMYNFEHCIISVLVGVVDDVLFEGGM